MSKKLQYLEQEPVEFDKIFRSKCKIRIENHFVEENLFLNFTFGSEKICQNRLVLVRDIAKL